MAQTQLTSNSVITLQNGLKLLAWGMALFAALSITTLPGNWGHLVCGVWGCGPTTQALVGCHLAWLVLLAPLVMILGRSNYRIVDSPKLLGMLFCITGALLLVIIVFAQAVTWWPAASEWQRSFFWQRCGFVVLTTVDIPILQLLGVGLVLIWRGRSSSFSPKEHMFSPEAGEVRL